MTTLGVTGATGTVGGVTARLLVAAAAGVGHVVYTSFIGAGDASGFTLARDHGATEDVLRGSGMAWTFLRDSFYAEVLPLFAADEGVIRGPAGSGRVAVVSQRDVTAVAAAVLADPGPHRGATYDLTGPEALSPTDAARSSGHEVRRGSHSTVTPTVQPR